VDRNVSYEQSDHHTLPDAKKHRRVYFRNWSTFLTTRGAHDSGLNRKLGYACVAETEISVFVGTMKGTHWGGRLPLAKSGRATSWRSGKARGWRHCAVSNSRSLTCMVLFPGSAPGITAGWHEIFRMSNSLTSDCMALGGT